MITTQRQISEQILRRLRGVTDETSFDEREIQLAVKQTLASIVRNRYFQGKQTETGEVDGSLFFTLEENKVLKDRLGRFYIETPSSSIALPFGVDIRKLWKTGGSSFIEVPIGFLDLYEGNDAYLLAGKSGFFREGNKIILVNVSEINNPKKLNITMLLPFDRLDEDDSVTVPADMVDEAIEIVAAKFANTSQLKQDETNDSNAN